MSEANESCCDLCGQSLTDAGDRCCGLEVCPACYSGDLIERVEPRGFAIEVETWVTKSNNDDDVDVHHTRVTGTVKTAVQPQATFTRERLGTRIARFFGRGDIEVGDSLFDDTVWVETETEEQTRRLLSEAGIHDVILEAISDFRSIRFSPAEGGCAVKVYSNWSTRSVMPDVHSHQRIVASALHYLQRGFPA